MTQQPEAPIAYLEWSLHVDCPQCDGSNDLADSCHDGEWQIAGHIFKNDWHKLQGWEIVCEHCHHEFKIKEVIY